MAYVFGFLPIFVAPERKPRIDSECRDRLLIRVVPPVVGVPMAVLMVSDLKE